MIKCPPFFFAPQRSKSSNTKANLKNKANFNPDVKKNVVVLLGQGIGPLSILGLHLIQDLYQYWDYIRISINTGTILGP